MVPVRQRNGGGRVPRSGNSCVIEGTEVLLLTGYKKKIEEIQPFTPKSMHGDVLLAVDGTPQYVVGVYSNVLLDAPSNMCIEFQVESDSGKHQITVTPQHSLMMNHFSMVQAAFLDDGDTVITQSGEATIVHRRDVSYPGRVWNLYLASKEFADRIPQMAPDAIYACQRSSLLGLSPKQHLFFANGFCSGDLMIQLELVDFYRRGFNVTQFA